MSRIGNQVNRYRVGIAWPEFDKETAGTTLEWRDLKLIRRRSNVVNVDHYDFANGFLNETRPTLAHILVFMPIFQAPLTR